GAATRGLEGNAMNAAATSRDWAFPQPYGWRALLIVIAAFAILFYSGQRVEVGRMIGQTGDSIMAGLGLKEPPRDAPSLGRVLGNLVPIQLSDRQEIGRIADFDPDHLPPF